MLAPGSPPAKSGPDSATECELAMADLRFREKKAKIGGQKGQIPSPETPKVGFWGSGSETLSAR